MKHLRPTAAAVLCGVLSLAACGTQEENQDSVASPSRAAAASQLYYDLTHPDQSSRAAERPQAVWIGDVKDHPRFRTWSGDVKDHPRYGAVALATSVSRAAAPCSEVPYGGCAATVAPAGSDIGPSPAAGRITHR